MEDRISISIQAYGITHSSDLPESCTAAEIIEISSQMVESIGFDLSLVIEGLYAAIDKRI